jgi:hypothetical protein
MCCEGYDVGQEKGGEVDLPGIARTTMRMSS